MAGIKRRTAYRKVVTDDVLYGTPELGEGQRIAIVVQSHGGNLLAVRTDSDGTGLAILPTKFRKLIWIKRGDYVVVSESSGQIETADGDEGRVRFLIETVLYPDAIKELQKQGKWPASFDREAAASGKASSEPAGRGLPPADNDEEDGEESGDDNDATGIDQYASRNRYGRAQQQYDDDDDDDDEEEGSDDGNGSDEDDDDGAYEITTDKFGNTVKKKKTEPVAPASISSNESTSAGVELLAGQLQDASIR